MSENRQRPGLRALDIAVALCIVAVVVVELTGGLVLEVFSVEVTVATTRGIVALFVLLWLVRTALSGGLGGALRSGLKGLAWTIALMAVLGLVNWSATAVVSRQESWKGQAPPEASPGGLEGSESWNVLLISLDTLRADHLGCYGYWRDTSPAIDRLAAEGALFRNQIAPAPSTLPSHASMFTSTNPTVHGARLRPPRPLGEGALTLAEILKAEGFATAAITNGGQLDRTFNLTQGFDLYTDRDEPLRKMRRRVGRWLRQTGDDRWFLFFHTYQTHLPYEPHTGIPYAEGYDGDLPQQISAVTTSRINRGELKITDADLAYIVALYDGEISYADRHLERLFDELRSAGMWDDTLIVVTSDHGEEFGEHGKVGAHSHTLYDELLRVPLILRMPGHFEGVEIEQMTRGIDLAPTILDALGIPIPEQMQGVSLLPSLDQSYTGPGLPAVSEKAARPPQISWRTADAKLIYPIARVGHESWLRKLGFGLAADSERLDPLRGLFLLHDDPAEQRSVYGSRTWRGQALLGDLASAHERDRQLAAGELSTSIDEELTDRLEALGYVQ
jgi:arylsulfatase A-like enzyme